MTVATLIQFEGGKKLSCLASCKGLKGGRGMNFQTKKGAKIAFSIFATLSGISTAFLFVEGLNAVTLILWVNCFVFLVNTGTCMGYLERIEELEVKNKF